VLFLSSFSALLFLLLLVTTAGRRIADLFPTAVKESSAFYVAPLLGLACLILTTTLYGWLSPFKPNISLPLTIGLLVLGVLFEKDRSMLFRDWFIVSVFASVVTIPILAPAIRFDGFNPCTDIFTYLAQGQWLQGHAFSEAARASGFFPAETQVVLYQTGGYRMGASFLLGFVQSLFHFEWSYGAFLPTVSLAFAVGSLALGGIIRQVLPVSKKVCLALCTLPAFTLNGFVFGAQWGFFPQVFGLAFAAGLACLIPALVGDALESKPSRLKQSVNLFPLAVCFSALLISYNDMFPVIGAGTFLFFFLMFAICFHERARLFGIMIILAAQVCLLVNFEGLRILKNYMHSLLGAGSGSIRFGWPVFWSPLQFLAHSFGMKAPSPNDVFFMDSIISNWIFPALMIVIVIVLVKIFRAKPKNLTLLFLFCMEAVFLLAFMKFRYATPGFPGEIGHTFLQFKIAKWAAPINLSLLGIVIAWFLLKGGKSRSVVKYAFGAAFVVGMAIQGILGSKEYIKHFQEETMRKRSPFNAYLDLRASVEAIPKDEVVYLAFAGHYKLRQIATYILSDRKLASDYSDDGYILNNIPKGEINIPLETAKWMIQYKPVETSDEEPLYRTGPFLIRRAPFNFFLLQSIAMGYDTETEGKRSWNWVKDSVEYRFHNAGKRPKAKVKFQFQVTGQSRTLLLDLRALSGKPLASFKIPIRSGRGDYESPVVDTNAEDVFARLSADGEPIRISAKDPREAKFLIKDLSLESVP
jgi:hypothetical protein